MDLSKNREMPPVDVILAAAESLAILAGQLEEAAKAGQQHSQGVYIKQKASVITMDGRSDQVKLVGAIVPIGLLVALKKAVDEAKKEGMEVEKH